MEKEKTYREDGVDANMVEASRLELHMSKEEFAEKILGCKLATYFNKLCGNAKFNLADLSAISRAAGKPLDYYMQK